MKFFKTRNSFFLKAQWYFAYLAHPCSMMFIFLVLQNAQRLRDMLIGICPTFFNLFSSGTKGLWCLICAGLCCFFLLPAPDPIFRRLSIKFIRNSFNVFTCSLSVGSCLHSKKELTTQTSRK